jgi:hypothetical protein
VTIDEVKAIIASDAEFSLRVFEVMREIANLVAAAEDEGDAEKRAQARDLIIRCLERRELMGDASAIHDALLSRIGLYPYLDDPGELPLGDRIAYEAHRPLVQPHGDFVFHEVQAQVYARLMDGENVILTAPTSFGKTLIVDALVASGEYNNVVVIVPTIALIDEVRRRLARLNEKHELGFKVITHPGQSQGERNIFVFTQERLLEEKELPAIDLAVVDEFYKLSIGRDPERSALLNLALARLRRKARQLYLLGPNVGQVRELPADFEHRYIPSRDSTVAFDVIDVERTGDDRADLVTVCRALTEPTLIYVSSPRRAHEVASWLVEAGISGEGVREAADWVSETYHPDWILVRSLRSGIGIHHGRLPRALGHYIVSAFNDGRLSFLVCTSTLIEGVNTTAKNIIILDNKIERRKLDLFTFRNIQGRSGRMFEHFVGRVFLFDPAPQDELPSIDIPAISQSEDAPPELLLGLQDDELTTVSRTRIAPYLDQDLLSVEVLRENAVDPDAQLALAQTLHDDRLRWSSELAWRGFPTYDQLLAACELIWSHFASARSYRWGVGSPAQLTLLLWRVLNRAPLKTLIQEQLEYLRSQGRDDKGVDDVVLDVLSFARNGLSFGFPKYLRVLSSIQDDVFGKLGLPQGDFASFAAAAEGAFLPPPLAALDEYGLPFEMARALQSRLLPRGGDVTLDSMLEHLRSLDIEQLARTPFELELLRETQRDA